MRAAEGVTAIVHAAGLVKARRPEEFIQVNTGGTENVSRPRSPTRRRLRRFVFVSSQSVAGPSDALGTAVDIDALPRPVTNYGRSKLAAEEKVLARQGRRARW